MVRRSDGPAGLRRLARDALSEDRVARDRTTRAVVSGGRRAVGSVTAQAPGVLSGLSAAVAVARSAGLRVTFAGRDGRRVRRGTRVLTVAGDARRILAAERTILNFLMHASGVATTTAQAVANARGARPPLEVWGTRKTLPGLRDLEKAAVRHGGGRPHRRDLSDGILIKNNHLALVPLRAAVRRARTVAVPGERVQVEVRSVREAVEAVRAGADALLLDNLSPARARRVVSALRSAGLRRGCWVELSGGITPETIRRYRSVGADAASLGALTHSAPALPFHLSLRPLPGS